MLKTRFKKSIALMVIFGLILSAPVSLAATTIGSNISTGGTLTVNGNTLLTSGLQITSGVPALGKVLTSDASGNATWQLPSAGVETDPVYSASSWFSTTNNAATWDTAVQPGDNVSTLTNDAGYLTGITSGDVTSALGFTPYDASNPSGYISGITSGDVTSALGFTPYDASNPSGYISGITSGDVTTALGFTPISGITSGDVTTALGFTPYDASNPSGYISGITSGDVTTALGFTPYDATNPAGYITGISGLDVTTALGFTPYDASNPSGYISASSADNLTNKTGNISQWTNNAGYLTSYTETDPQVNVLNANQWCTANGAGTAIDCTSSVPSGAPVGARYITQTADGTLTNEQALDVLATGLVKNTTGSGVLSIASSGTDYSAGTSGLATGILKSTTGTGALSIAVAGDFPILNQNTTGTASNVTGTVVIANGGTGLTAAPASGQLLIGNAGNYTLAGLTGTANQITVTTGPGSITLSTPQNTATTSTPTFAGLTLNLTSDATGDIYYRSAGGALARLGIGTSGQYLTVSGGGLPSWTTLSGGGISSLNGLSGATQTFTNDTNVTITSAGTVHSLGWAGQLSIARGGTNSTATPSNGGVAYGTGSAYAFSSAGTSGQILKSNAASAPTWSDEVNSIDYLFGYDTTNQAVAAAGTFQTINFDNPTSTSNGWTYSAGDFTCPVTGLYLVQFYARVGRANNGDAAVTVRVNKNGTEIPGSVAVSSPSRAFPVDLNNAFIVSLSSSDLLRFQITSSAIGNSIGLYVVSAYGTVQPRITVSITRIK